MSALRQGKRRKMLKFRIDEVASCDSPAQEGARAVFIKRDFSGDRRKELADSGAAMPDGSFPIVTTADLANAIQAFGRANEGDRAAVAKHIKARATALGATDQLPTSGVLAGFFKKESNVDAAELAKLNEQITNLTARAERAEKVQALPAEQRSHFDGLEKTAQDAFLAKSEADRKSEVAAELAKRSDANPVVYTDNSGVEYRKNDDQRLVALAKRSDEDRKELAKQRAANEQASFEKRAAEELPNLPGTLPERAAVIRALDGITDEPTRKAAHAAIKAGDSAIKAAFASVGHKTQTGAEGSAEAELDKMAKALAAKDSISYVDAYEKVATANPELAKRAIEGEPKSN